MAKGKTKSTKLCRGCEQTKPRAEFYPSKKSGDGLVNKCKPCWTEQCWRLQIWQKYGITPEEYMALFAQQKGRCAICRVRTSYRLHVDHDHETSVIRGLLCGDCNRAIGLLKEDPKVLKRAFNYLKAAA